MTGVLPIATYLGALEMEGARTAAAAETGGLTTPIPTCPGWTMWDLIRHTGAVHRWATDIVATPRTEEWWVDFEGGPWPEDAELIDWFRSGVAGLLETLRAAPSDLECWAFLAAPTPLLMWARRQAHETAIHRLDAETPTGGVSDFDPAFAADGVDELLSCHLPRRSPRTPSGQPVVIQVRATDSGDEWSLLAGAGPISTPHRGARADCRVEGRACDLYAFLWNRRDATGIEVGGDATLMDWWRERVRVL
ncbi:MAG: maleylpyruvate isomerase family mycothiol-dependent enzyme [Acidimicrobiia bacterium]